MLFAEEQSVRSITYATSAILDRLSAPGRAARFRRHRTPFIHRGKHGLVFELHPGEEIDGHIAIYGIYEHRLLRLLESLIPANAVMLDIGANIGNHALYLARQCSAVHCFEPNPRAYARLERNIALNNAANIQVHRFGLSSRNETAIFYENASGNLGASGFRSSEGERRELPIRNADDAVAELSLSRIDLVKIDVEGMEPEVISGLRETIARFRPIIAFEYSGHRHANWPLIHEALSGYEIFEPLFRRGVAALLNGGMPKLHPVGRPEDRWYESLIAIPLEAPR